MLETGVMEGTGTKATSDITFILEKDLDTRNQEKQTVASQDTISEEWKVEIVCDQTTDISVYNHRPDTEFHEEAQDLIWVLTLKLERVGRRKSHYEVNGIISNLKNPSFHLREFVLKCGNYKDCIKQQHCIKQQDL